jgi:putative peptide zinc metalloprotease protein
MAQLRLGYQEIQKRNAEVLQVTYSTPEEARLYFRQYQLTFPYLCDPERAVYRLYGIPMAQTSEVARSFVAGPIAEMSDRLLRGEKSASPSPYFKRYGFTDMNQAVFIIDKSGIIRHVHTTGPIGAIPSNTDLRQLDTLQ